MNELFDYYNSYDEHNRLERENAHKIEKVTTQIYLEKTLPTNATILDCCAGTGEYSFWLAQKGHKVLAGDIMPKHVDIMKASPKASLLKDIFTINVLDMSQLSDSSFDVVLCMGLFYHSHDKCDREKAISECLRVLKKDGIFVLAYINRNAIYINHFKRDPAQAVYSNVMKHGQNGVFYGTDICEINEIVKSKQLKTLFNIGVDGLMYPLVEEINSLNDEQFEKYMEYHLLTCTNPSLIGHSMHGLYIGKK